MRISKTEYAFDGEVAEFKEVAHLFMPPQQQVGPLAATEAPKPHVDGAHQADAATPASPAPNTTPAPTPAAPVLTVDAVKAVFQKRPLTTDQTKVVKLVHQAGAAGTTTEDIAAATGFDRKTVKAQIRLLGKRVHHTQEWPDKLEVFNRQWEGTRNRYRMHDAMRGAIDNGEVQL